MWRLLRWCVRDRSLFLTLANYRIVRHFTINGHKVRATIRPSSDVDVFIIRIINNQSPA